MSTNVLAAAVVALFTQHVNVDHNKIVKHPGTNINPPAIVHDKSWKGNQK